MSDLLVDVASAKSGLKAFDLLRYTFQIDSLQEKYIYDFYHGTKNNFDKFSNSDSSDENGIGSGLGYFFTDSKEYALEYSGDNGWIFNVKLNIKNPLVIDDYEGISEVNSVAYNNYCMRMFNKSSDEIENSDDDIDSQNTSKMYDYFGGKMDAKYLERRNKQVRLELKSMGYDGVILIGDRQHDAKTKVAIVFDSKQIKIIEKNNVN